MQTSRPAPSLRARALVFLAIGMQSFGGRMSAWMRREVVQRRGWMPEAQFVSGMALCQIVPDANGGNLAVFTVLLGWLFLRVGDAPGVEPVMTGLGRRRSG